MYQRKIEKDIRCPLEYGLGDFRRKVGVPHYLRAGGKGDAAVQRELRREMGNITDAVLAASLKQLISDEIVARKSYDEIPPRVEYSLTERGKSVVPILQRICRWAGAFHKEDYENTMIQCRKCDYRN